MFICMSSGYRERYRQDVILALAMPKGSRLQFRYDKKWIAPEVLERLKKRTFKGMRTLIAYIAQYDKNKIPELIPCRFAKISDTKIHGTTVSLGLSLEEFAYAENKDSFNAQARSSSDDTLPNWDVNKHIKGYYWLEIDGEEPSAVTSSEKEDAWEKIVDQIAQHTDFADDRCFYMMKGIYPIESENKLSIKDDSCNLEHSHEYEVQIYHYHPQDSENNAFLRFHSMSSSIKFTSNPIVIVNSRYDFKRIRFKTTSPIIAEQAVLSIYRGKDESKDKYGILDFDLKMRIAGTWSNLVFWGTTIGVLLAIPHLITALTNDKLTGAKLAVVCLLVLIVGLVTGNLVAFKLKKDI